jgi:hypothetical protein
MGDVVQVGLFAAHRSVNRALRMLESLPITDETALQRAEFVRVLTHVGTKLIDLALQADSAATRRAAMLLADRIYACAFDEHVPECSA